MRAARSAPINFGLYVKSFMSYQVNQELVNVEVAGELGLTEDEFSKISDILGRVPNFTELSIYSGMWSEHCSYKNSIVWLKTLPKDGPHMLVKAGEENAGLVDIGEGLACAFKIESHNHPSALEPFQGAATGVGGINRDIFTTVSQTVDWGQNRRCTRSLSRFHLQSGLTPNRSVTEYREIELSGSVMLGISARLSSVWDFFPAQ